MRDDGAAVATSELDLGGGLARPEAGPLRKDAFLLPVLGGAFAASYLLFKVVSILAGLPFP